MNNCVPDFDVEVDFSLPSTSDQSRRRKSSMAPDEVMELLWQNGQVVMQSQNQRSVRKSPPPKLDDAAIPPELSCSREIREEDRHFFVQEDEMTSWIHYPLVDDSTLDPNFCTDLLYSTPPQCVSHNINSNDAVRTSQGIELQSSVTVTAAVAQQPPVASIKRTESQTKGHNVLHLAENAPRVDSLTSTKKSVVQDLTVVDSCGTLSVGLESRASEMVRTGVAEPSNNDGLGRGTVISCSPAGTSACVGGVSMGKETITCEVTVTSSPGDSCASASASPSPDPSSTEKLVSNDRKRKGREAAETECYSEDVDFESGDVKKQVRGSTSNKRPRAAEVHNLSERRRRDRINEKMRALQELIPRCNKCDKASMLDEAIEYLKSLQLQVQMMSMGCGMMPMMFPGVQSYMPPMGMCMEMGLNRPVMPFPNMVAASVLPTPAGAPHIGPRFPMPSFHMTMAPRNDPSKPSDPGLNMLGTPTMNQLRVPHFLDAYPQFHASHPVQMSPTQLQQQKQPATQLSPRKPCSSRGRENPRKHLPGGRLFPFDLL